MIATVSTVCVCVCVCVCVFIKLHITTQPGPDIMCIFLCYSNRSSLWGISDCYRHDISLIRRDKGGHALPTLSLTAYRLPSGFLFVSIVTWPVLPHNPTPTPLPIFSSFYTLGLVPSTVKSCSRGGHRDSQLRVLVAGLWFPTLSNILFSIY